MLSDEPAVSQMGAIVTRTVTEAPSNSPEHLAAEWPNSLKNSARWRVRAGASGLEGCCSIQLSYGRGNRPAEIGLRKVLGFGSGRQSARMRRARLVRNGGRAAHQSKPAGSTGV